MLPKKRKFTAADYDRFIVGSPSHITDEDNDSEQPNPAIATSNDNILPVTHVSDSIDVSEVVVSNNNECDSAKANIHHSNESATKPDEETHGCSNDVVSPVDDQQETVGIDLSQKRHDTCISRSPGQSPHSRQQLQQCSSSSSENMPSEQSHCSSRRISSSFGEPYKVSCAPERCIIEEAVRSRQQPITLPPQRHRYMSSPLTNVQYSNRNAIPISTPIGHHNQTRPRSATSDVAQGNVYCRSDQTINRDPHLEIGSQFFQSRLSTETVASAPISHVENPSSSSSFQRQRFDASQDIDLSDWVGHRILAKRPGRDGTSPYYWPGVIHSSYEDNRVSVLFDGEEIPSIYDNVLSMARCAIVSDAIPSTSQVCNFIYLAGMPKGMLIWN